MKEILYNILEAIQKLFLQINKIINYYKRSLTDNLVNVLSISYDEKGRYLSFVLSNNNLLDNYTILKSIYKCLMTNDKFLAFGFNKIIIISAIIEDSEFSFHHNILINNNTSLEEYHDKVYNRIKTLYDDGYQIDTVPLFKVLVWNVDNLLNKNIKITHDARKVTNQKRSYHSSISNITPLKKTVKKASLFGTMDIETNPSFKGNQIPTLISFKTPIEIKSFKIDNILLFINEDLAVSKLWLDFFNYLEKIELVTIFVHNLGDFDGIFLYKALLYHFEPTDIRTIIDDQNRFILISFRHITFKDSLRLFPTSLDNFCNIFNVEGKINPYKEDFQNLDIFNKPELLEEFITYSIQDSEALFNALIKAQQYYIQEYKVDITSVVSIPSLTLKIYRTDFLPISIPLLSYYEDAFIRPSYYGGATDYYEGYVENLYYYDVNSLYPDAMCEPMPYKIIKKYNTEKACDNINLDNFFGFIEVDIECPNSVERPVLPVHYNGRTIYPRGRWTATYFSEELKAVLPLGYILHRKLKAIEYSKIDLFTRFVTHLYEKKQNSKGAARYITKLLMNSLYGIFGRKKELIETITIKKSELFNYASTNIIKSIIEVNDELVTILIIRNLDYDIIKELNIDLSISVKDSHSDILANVAIASAITSYARIKMIPFKLLPGTVYTDTDSIFTRDKLDPSLIGKDHFLFLLLEAILYLETFLVKKGIEEFL